MRKSAVHAAVTVALLISAWLALEPRPPLQAQAQEAPDFTALDKVALDELKQTNTPGAAVAVVRGDAVLLARGYGIANVETGEAVRPDMLFRLGSTTKMLTATLVNLLVEDGALKLDAPIGTYISGLDARVGAVSPHHLLTHTAGIRDEAPMFGAQDDAALGARVTSIDAAFLFAPPGDVFSYSNPGYWIAGYLAEAVGRKPYADLMQERVFAPVGMAHTTLRPTVAMTYPLAQGHAPGAKGAAEVIRPAANNVATWPAGSVYSNVNDLARFVKALLHEGRVDGKQALPGPVVRRLTTGYAEIAAQNGTKYGYGLEVAEVGGKTVWRHGGSRSGYGSSIAMVPADDVGVIVLANRTGAGMPRTTAKALEVAAGLRPATTEASDRAPVAMTAAEMAEMAGRYSQTTVASAELFVKEGRLLLKIGAAAPMPVTKLAATRFIALRPPESPLPFFLTRGRDGKALYLHFGTRAMRKIAPSTT